jgi:cyclohexyl-isocyanide hydratase
MTDIHIGFLLFPQVTQLDMTGPAQVLSRVPGAKMHYIWKSQEPVMTDAGFAIVPNATFETTPQLDVLIVPGGFGTLKLLEDDDTLAFLKRQGERAKYVCSVCNGSMVLGAAGLLNGYKSACHWAWGHTLQHFGATWVQQRVVRDRNRLSGGGVTAGIDFGLTLAAELAGEDVAKTLQLSFEYDPAPPFDCGSPTKAGPERTAMVRATMAQRAGDVDAAIAKLMEKHSTHGS